MNRFLKKIDKGLPGISNTWFRLRILQSSLVLLFLFPIRGYCQSMIKGNLYLFDSKEPAVGYYVMKYDSLKVDSTRIIETIGNINGDFIIRNGFDKTIDLQFKYVGYRNTIVKNIPQNKDTIYLNRIPLFINDNVIHVSLVLNKKQRFFARFRKKYWHDQSIIGVEGPFTYKDKLYLNCDFNSQDSIGYERKGQDIYVDYNKIKTCGNRVDCPAR